MSNESWQSPQHERLIYRYGNFVLAWVLAKRVRAAVDGGALLDSGKIEAALSLPFDEMRQALADAFRRCVRGPLAVFRNQGEALPVVRDLAITSYGLSADPVVGFKVANDSGLHGYPKDLFDYLVSKAPQIGEIV